MIDGVIQHLMARDSTLAQPTVQTMKANLSTGPLQKLPEWGRHMKAPTLRPMAMRMASLGIQRPSEETGGAFNHAPDSNVQAPSRLVPGFLAIYYLLLQFIINYYCYYYTCAGNQIYI